jgi:hypothetical protein
MEKHVRSPSQLIVAVLASLMFATMTAIADDYFVTKDPIFVFATEGDCGFYIDGINKQDHNAALTKLASTGHVGKLPAGSELVVENVGSNGIDKIKVKGYPIDLFTPNLLGFGQNRL